MEEQTGLNRGWLSRLERGAIRTTAESKVRQIATVLDTDPDLLELKEKP